jgi:hypothetical protein
MDQLCSMYWNGENAFKILVGKPKGRDYLERLGVDVRIMSKLT